MTRSIASQFTSVTRWLLVVVGCAVLATAQPMSAADAPTGERTQDTIIYPKNVPAPAGQGSAEGGKFGSNYFAISALLLACAGGWVMWQKRRGLAPLGRAGGRLSVEETKSLGNRQYLVIASCDGKRLLLGVTPGQIQLLSPLDPKPTSDAP